MTALFIILAALAILFIGYLTYGSWLAKQWGVDPTRPTPAKTMEDGVDYVAAKPYVLMGPDQRSDPGQCIRLGPGLPLVRDWRHLLRRSAGLRFSVRLDPQRR